MNVLAAAPTSKWISTCIGGLLGVGLFGGATLPGDLDVR